MDSFLINPFSFVEETPYNGFDGFGDANLTRVQTRAKPGHAVDAIIRIAKLYKGSYLQRVK